MKSLELKLFDVLTDEMSFIELERFLYEALSANGSLMDNNLFFDLISINYRKKDATQQIKNLALDYFSEDYVLLTHIKKLCYAIEHGFTLTELEIRVNKLMLFFDFWDGHKILWDFYHLESDISLYQMGYYSKDEILHFSFELATSISDFLSKCQTKSEELEILDKQFYYDQRRIVNSKKSNGKTWFNRLKKIFKA